MSITVTAAETGTTFWGILLRVYVLTGAAGSQAGAATQTHAGTGAQEASITTTVTGSMVYGALKTSSTTALTAASGTTLADNVVDTTSTEVLGTCHTTSATGTPGATTVGASAPSVGGQAALLEILPSGTITVDGSSPAVVDNLTGATAVTTTAFTPPAGSLLVAIASADASSATVVTVSGGSLTWTQRVHSLAGGGASGYAGVWTAAVPGGATVTLGSALAVTPAFPAATVVIPDATVNLGSALAVTAAFPAPAASTPVPQLEDEGGSGLLDEGGLDLYDESFTGASVTPATLAVSTAQPAPAVVGGANPAPAALAASTAQPAVTVVTGETATPATLAVTATIPAPAASGNAAVTTAILAVATTQPAITAGQSISGATDSLGPYLYPDITSSDGTNTYINNDVWNPGAVSSWSQTITARNPGSWTVVANIPTGSGGAVVSYPDVQQLYAETPISHFADITSSFTEAMNATTGSECEAAFDIWCNSYGDEIMIWVDNHGQSFSGDTNLGTVTLGGLSYTIYHFPGGTEYIYSLNTTITSGTVDVLAVLVHAQQHFMAANSTLTAIEFGWEISTTDGLDQAFVLSDFAITETVGGGTVNLQSALNAGVNIPPVTVSPAASYIEAVLQDSPSLLWEMTDTGSSAADATGNGNTGTYTGTYTESVTGPPGVATTATAFDGSTGYAYLGTLAQTAGISAECWVKVANAYSSGGGIMLAAASNFNVYMSGNGTVTFGIWDGMNVVACTSTAAYNDGNWHYVVAVYGNPDLSLYIDGTLAASNTDSNGIAATGGAAYDIAAANGYNISSNWPGTQTSNLLAGTVSCLAIYPVALSSSEITNHWNTAEAAAGSATITATVLAVTTAQAAVTISTGEVVTPATLAITTAQPAPSIPTVQIEDEGTARILDEGGGYIDDESYSASDATVTPATLAVTASQPAVTVSVGGSASAAPATLAVITAQPAVTVSTGETVTPVTLAVTGALPAPAVSAGGSATATPATVTVTVTIPAPVVTQDATVTPAVLAVTITIPAPAVGGGENAAPAVLTILAGFPAPATSAGATVILPALAVSASFPAPELPPVYGTVTAGEMTVPYATAGAGSAPYATGGAW